MWRTLLASSHLSAAHSGFASGRNGRTVLPPLEISWSMISFSSRSGSSPSSRYVLRLLNSRPLWASVPSFTDLYSASNTRRFAFSKMGAQSSAPRRAVASTPRTNGQRGTLHWDRKNDLQCPYNPKEGKSAFSLRKMPHIAVISYHVVKQSAKCLSAQSRGLTCAVR